MVDQFISPRDSIRFFCQVVTAWRHASLKISIEFSQYAEHAEIDIRQAAHLTATMRSKVASNNATQGPRYFSGCYLNWSRLLLAIFESN